jgi:hypothetical protein
LRLSRIQAREKEQEQGDCSESRPTSDGHLDISLRTN